MNFRNGSGKIKFVWVQEDYDSFLKEMKDLRNKLLSKFYYALAFPEPRKEMLRKSYEKLDEAISQFKEVKESLLTQAKLMEELPHLELVEV